MASAAHPRRAVVTRAHGPRARKRPPLLRSSFLRGTAPVPLRTGRATARSLGAPERIQQRIRVVAQATDIRRATLSSNVDFESRAGRDVGRRVARVGAQGAHDEAAALAAGHPRARAGVARVQAGQRPARRVRCRPSSAHPAGAPGVVQLRGHGREGQGRDRDAQADRDGGPSVGAASARARRRPVPARPLRRRGAPRAVHRLAHRVLGKGGRRLRRRAAARAAVARAAESASYAAAAQKAAAGASQDAQAERAAEKAAGKMAGEKAAPAPEPLSASAADADSDADAATPSATPPLDAKTKELFLRNPRLAATYWRLARQHEHLGPDASADERAAAMRAHVAEEAALADGAAASRAGEGVLKLRRVLLSPSDEQKVFELGVRLSYADQPALLLAALTELREAVLADLPPQALLQRPRAVDATIALARAVDGPTAMSRVAETRTSGRDDDAVTPAAVRTAALVTLRAFCEALKGGARPRRRRSAQKSRRPPTRADAPEHVLPSSQLASRAALSYPPPAGGLAAFARFAPEPNAVPAAARHALGAPMPTLPAAHRIALAVARRWRRPPRRATRWAYSRASRPYWSSRRSWRATRRSRRTRANPSRSTPTRWTRSRPAALRTPRAAPRRLPARRGERAGARVEKRLAGRDGRRAPQGGVSRFLSRAGAGGGAHRRRRPGGCARGGRGRGVPARLVERLSTAAIDELLAAAVPGLRAAALGAAPRRWATTPRGASALPPRRRTWGCRLRRRPPRTTRRRRLIARRTRRRASRSPHSPRSSTSPRTRLSRSPRVSSRRCSLRRRAPPRRRTSRRSRATPSASPRRTGSSEAYRTYATRRVRCSERRRPSPRGAARTPRSRRRRRFSPRRRAAWTRTARLFPARTRRRARFPRRRAR